MDTLLIVLLVVLIIVLLAGGAVAWLVIQSGRWREQASQHLADLGQSLIALRDREKTLSAALKTYPVDLAPPYQVPAGQLNTLALDIRETTFRLRAAHRNHLQAINTRPEPAALLRDPFALRKLNNSAQALHTDLAALQGQHDQADSLIDKLDGLGWQTAQTARTLHQQLQRANQQLAELQQTGLHGDDLQDYATKVGDLHLYFDKLPEAFLTGTEDELRAQADHDMVVEAHALLGQIAPEARSIQRQAQHWQAQLRQAQGAVHALMAQLKGNRQAFDRLPAGIDTRHEAEELERLHEIAATMQDSAEQPETGALTQLYDDAERLRKRAAEMQLALEQSIQDIEILDRLLSELPHDIDVLRAEIIEAENTEVLPLRYDESTPALAALEDRLIRLQDEDPERSPRQLHDAVQRAQALLVDYQTIGAAVRQARDQQQACLELFARPELADGLQWFMSVENIWPRINTYHPSNWPKELRINSLYAEAQQIADMQAGLLPGDAPVAEGEINDRLSQANDLLIQKRNLDERLKLVQLRLDQLEDMSQLAQMQLRDGLTALEQLSGLAATCPDFSAISSRSLPKHSDRGNKLAQTIDDHSRGNESKKAKDVDNWYVGVLNQLRDWIRGLDDRTEKVQLGLATHVDQVEALALVSDQHLDTAHTLLSEALHPPAPGNDLSSLLNGITERCQTLSLWHAADENLVRELLDPLQAAYDAASAARAASETILNQGRNQLPDERGWPAHHTTLIEAEELKQQAEIAWLRLTRQPTASDQLLDLLTDFEQRFQIIIERTEQALAAADSEKQAVVEYENRIQSAFSQWGLRRRERDGDAYVTETIDLLLNDLGNEFEFIQRKYQTRVLNYQQVLGQLDNLVMRAERTLVPINDQQDLTVEGQVIPAE